MGSALLPSLVTAHRAKQLRLVLLHRSGSDTSTFPDDVEKRVIDLEGGEVKAIREKLEGLEVIMWVYQSSGVFTGTTHLLLHDQLFHLLSLTLSSSAISGLGGHQLQVPLLEAISTLPNFLTFFPSEWATPFRQEDYDKSPFLTDANKQMIRDKAKELGVGCTVVKNATVPYLLFGWP